MAGTQVGAPTPDPRTSSQPADAAGAALPTTRSRRGHGHLIELGLGPDMAGVYSTRRRHGFGVTLSILGPTLHVESGMTPPQAREIAIALNDAADAAESAQQRRGGR